MAKDATETQQIGRTLYRASAALVKNFDERLLTHDRGRVPADLAGAIADGGETGISTFPSPAFAFNWLWTPQIAATLPATAAAQPS